MPDEAHDSEDMSLADRLATARPTPREDFERPLRQDVQARERRVASVRSQRLAALGFAVIGLLLAILALLGVAGAGPFAA